MGACYDVISTVGVSPELLFSNLRETAIAKYGTDPYSGTIATTSLCGELKVPFISGDAKLTETQLQKVREYLMSDAVVGAIYKRECKYCKAGIEGYAEFGTKVHDNGLSDRHGYRIDVQGYNVRTKLAATKKEAIQIAKECADRYHLPVTVHGRVSGALILTCSLDIVRQSKRKITPQKKGGWVMPLYRYFFCFWAAE